MNTEPCACPVGVAEEELDLSALAEDGYGQFKVYVYGAQKHLRRLDRNFDKEPDGRRYGYELMRAQPGVAAFQIVDMRQPRQPAIWQGRRSDLEKHSIEALVTMRAQKAAEEKFEAVAENPAPNPLPNCMPWLRIEKDPAKFKGCMALSQQLGKIESSKQLYEVVRSQMEREDQEVYYVIALDTHLFLRGVAEVGRGARDSVHTSIQDTARYAIAFAQLYGAQAVAIAHNHPSGSPNPSTADGEVTKAMHKMCEANDLLFLDHIVVGSESYYSFKDSGKV